MGFVATDALTALEQALTTLVRNGNLWRLHDLVTADAGVELDRAAYGVLVTVEGGPGVRLSELANRLGIDISTASRHVQSLQQQGLVERSTDPKDRRAANLSLTGAGGDVLAKVHAARCRVLESIVVGWDDGDVEQLSRLMQRLADSLGSTLAEPLSIRG